MNSSTAAKKPICPPPSSSQVAGPRTAVLLIDDDPLVRHTARRIIEQLCCRVAEAASCAEAEELWKMGCFDLVVADYRLDDGLATDMLARMRSQGFSTPVVCITAETDLIPDKVRAQSEIQALIPKPLDPQQLKQVITRTLSRSRLTKVGANTNHKMPVTYVGRFELISCPQHLDAAVAERIVDRNLHSAWLALDLQDTARFDDDAMRLLLQAAAKCRTTGGRLCVAGASSQIQADLERLPGGLDVDSVRNSDSLRSLGRRLTSIRERESVLNCAGPGRAKEYVNS